MRLTLAPLMILLRHLMLVAALVLAAPVAAQEAATDVAPTEEDGTSSANSALSDLLATLKDDTARDALIAELEAAVSGTPEETPVVETLDEVGPSLGERIIEFTKSAATAMTEGAASVVSNLRGGQRLLRGLDADTWGVIGDAALDLALAIAVTVAVFLTLRRLAVPVLRRIGQAAKGAGLAQAVVAVVGSVVIRVLVVVVAWGVAYGLAAVIAGGIGQIGLRQSLFLNAFLVVELMKVAARTLVSPAADDLRTLPMSDWAARRTTRILGLAISVLGYGVLLVVPVVSETSGLLPTRAVSVLVVELTLLVLAIAIVWHRRRVADWLVTHILAPADPDATPRREGVRYTLLTHWHWFVLGYLLLLAVQILTRSLEVMGANVLSVLKLGAIAFAGVLVLRFLGRLTRAGVDMPNWVDVRLPLLEGRLNRVIPRVLIGVRGVVALMVVTYALDQTGLTNIWGWVRGDTGSAWAGTIVTVLVILGVAWLIWLAVSSWIDFRLNPDYGGAPSSRETTLLALLKNAVTVALLILAVMFALSELGLNIGPLIASAGVLGLAIGFGAQKLVQDIITGVFIQFENAINVGDVITVGGITGGVEKLTIRSVSLRDLHGVFHIVPFSSVDMVSNYTREFSYYVIDMGVAYREAVDEVRAAMEEAYDQLREDPDQGAFLLGDLEYFGLNAFGDSAIVVRARIKTWPGKQWGVGRAYNRVLKAIFDERGIEIPFPHHTITFAEAKDGSRQSLPIENVPSEGG